MFKRNLYLLFLISIFVSSLHAYSSAEVKSVNFLQEGEVSKLIIDFTDQVVAEKKHIKSDKQIILDIKNVSAQKRFLRGIDTSEFSGSTVYISPYFKPGSKNDLRFAIQLRDNVRSFIEKKKNRVILHIENRFGVFTKAKLKKVKEGNFDTVGSESNKKVLVPKSNSIEDILENLTQSGVKRYVGRKISLNVNNINYQEVLKMIGDTSGFNIIIEDEVKQLPPLTISLTNLPWDQVLDTVMNLGDLVATKFGNILTVTTAAKARQEKNMELSNQNKTKILEPLVTKIVPISYSKLEEISAILQAYSTPERGSIQSDNRTQNLIIKDTVDVVERMKKIIQTLDTQTPQILIEAKIVEATEDYELRAGLTEGLKLNYDPLGSASNLPADNGVFSLSTAPNKSAPGVLGASIGVARLTNLAFNLELMESESKGKIISAPKIITENNKAATISDTRERFFPLTSINQETGLEVTSTQTLQATINLTVTPKVTNEGAIAMDVNITKEGFGIPDAGELPPTTSRNVQTSVLVENGSTVVIGGIYLTEDKTVESGVPFLKDLPLIGWLFRSVYNPTKTRNELVIFLTPRIVNQEAAGLVNRDADNGVNI